MTSIVTLKSLSRRLLPRSCPRLQRSRTSHLGDERPLRRTAATCQPCQPPPSPPSCVRLWTQSRRRRYPASTPFLLPPPLRPPPRLLPTSVRQHSARAATNTTAAASCDDRQTAADLARRLLGAGGFRDDLAAARRDGAALREMLLEPRAAATMLVLPRALLRDVHAAVVHFAAEQNFRGLPAAALGDAAAPPGTVVPGPVLCVRLLERLGIPQHYLELAAAAGRGPARKAPPTLVVHSSQVDVLLDCCLQTTLALARSCEPGRWCLAWSDFGAGRSAARLAEEIWRSVWNMEIKFTSGRRRAPRNVAGPTPIRIGRIGSLGTEIRIGRIGGLSGEHSVARYLREEEEAAGAVDFFPEGPAWVPVAPELASATEDAALPWTAKDQRRRDRAVILFNAVLACHAKSAASAGGGRPGERLDSLRSTERLLEQSVAAWGEAGAPTAVTALRHAPPDAISFNTTLLAWASHAPRRGGDEAKPAAAVAAARTESILGLMTELFDRERSRQTTTQAVRAAWEEQDRGGDGAGGPPAPPAVGGTIAPNTSSYNTVLQAASRGDDPEAARRALRICRTLARRGHAACPARRALARRSPAPRRETAASGDATPDSRTLVSLLQALTPGLPASLGFRDALDAVEEVYRVARGWDEQARWSADRGLLNASDARRPLLNVHVYNTLIKTLSKLPSAGSYEESLRCCERIDGLLEEMRQAPGLGQGDVVHCLPNVVAAWANCTKEARDRPDRVRLCADKVGAHMEALLADFSSGPSKAGREDAQRSYLLRAVNESIELYGRARMPARADELFLRAKECGIHNLGTLSALVDALCGDGADIAHVDQAQSHLLSFEREQMRPSYPSLAPVPDMKYTSMYNAVLDGFLRCKAKRRGLERAQQLLAHMVASHEANPRHIARPNTTSFARVMAALAHRDDHVGLLEGLLHKMETLDRRKRDAPRGSPEADLLANVAPNVVIYNLLLKSYARRGHDNGTAEDAVQSAIKLLARMEKNPEVKPDSVSHSYMAALLTRSQNNEADKLSGRGESESMHSDIDNLDSLNLSELNPTSTLTSKSFNSIMNVYATMGTREGAEKSAALLRKLEEMHSSGDIGFRPNIFLYNNLMHAWQLCEQKNTSSDPAFSPAEKAQEILDDLCHQHEMGSGRGVAKDQLPSPNGVSFSTCIHAWCKSSRPDASERSEQIFRRKEAFAEKYSGIKISCSDYNAVISKWKDDHATGPERATRLFEEMLNRYGDSEEGTRPNSFTLNALLNVYAKRFEYKHLAEKAEQYLRRTNQLHKEGKCCILPDVISYRSVIGAWIRQWRAESPTKVYALVKEMTAKYEQEGRKDLCPDGNTFNLVLKACSHAPAMWNEKDVAAKGDGHPIAIANQVFSLLKRKNKYGATADHATYSYMFCLYRQHMDFHNERYPPLMHTMWKHCCKDGLVSQFSLESFRNSVLEPDFWKAVGGQDRYRQWGKTDMQSIVANDLPKEWCRNVSLKRST